jgi:hypothetical protein
MDPKACLDLLCDEYDNAAPIDELRPHALAFVAWIRAGGFCPAITARHWAALAGVLGSRDLAYLIREDDNRGEQSSKYSAS